MKHLFATLIMILTCAEIALCQNHIKELDTVRSSLVETGNQLPAIIKNAPQADLRTLERIFEINTYALTTIESYFKMIKVTITSGGAVNKEVIKVFNDWLRFIAKFCRKDIEYLDEAIAQTKDAAVAKILQTARKNIQALHDVTMGGIEENQKMVP